MPLPLLPWALRRRRAPTAEAGEVEPPGVVPVLSCLVWEVLGVGVQLSGHVHQPNKTRRTGGEPRRRRGTHGSRAAPAAGGGQDGHADARVGLDEALLPVVVCVHVWGKLVRSPSVGDSEIHQSLTERQDKARQGAFNLLSHFSRDMPR